MHHYWCLTLSPTSLRRWLGFTQLVDADEQNVLTSSLCWRKMKSNFTVVAIQLRAGKGGEEHGPTGGEWAFGRVPQQAAHQRGTEASWTTFTSSWWVDNMKKCITVPVDRKSLHAKIRAAIKDIGTCPSRHRWAVLLKQRMTKAHTFSMDSGQLCSVKQLDFAAFTWKNVFPYIVQGLAFWVNMWLQGWWLFSTCQ